MSSTVPPAPHPTPPVRRSAPALVSALRLQLLDRWPHAAAHPAFWDGLGTSKAFSARWQDEAVPDEVARWYERIDRLPQTSVASRLRSWRSSQLIKNFQPDPRSANVGLGARHKNSLQVALAVDSYFDGAPATAMPWSGDADPVVVASKGVLAACCGPALLLGDEARTRRIVASWGAGAKGIASIRDPSHPTHRVVNVVSPTGRADDVTFFDYSEAAADQTRPCGARTRAEQHLSNIDEHSGFASIRLWRTADLPSAAKLPPGFFRLPTKAARDIVNDLLPDDMPSGSRHEAFDRIWFFGEHAYARWLFTQIGRGACTFDPGQLHRLTIGAATPPLSPLTEIDGSLCWLADRGSATLTGSVLEITLADTPATWTRLAVFGEPGLDRDGLVVRYGAVDGLAAGTVEVCLGRELLDRINVRDTSYRAPLPTEPIAAPDRPIRGTSWIDTNRGGGVGSRKTNCWNTAAAIAGYLSTAAPTMSLPIYKQAPLRPTIPEYLTMLGVTGSTTFVENRAEADDVVASWGPHQHGLVLAAWSAMSTHIFNVLNDGLAIRYLDGHTAEEGDFNFDIRWQRIGIVAIGDLHPQFRSDLPQGVVGDLRIGLA